MARKPTLNRRKKSRKGLVNLFRMGGGLRAKLFYWRQQDERRDGRHGAYSSAYSKDYS